ncbi:MAG TPA: hypothetical protein VG992_03020 [Candidatus Saccharimonadales bacterium]|nr:hypothetical protein [Candidatus Saccharimonadales bacterium]
MNIPDLEKFVEFCDRSARRPHRDRAIKYAGLLASRTEILVARHEVVTAPIVKKELNRAWKVEIEPRQNNGDGIYISDQRVRDTMYETLATPGHWVHGEEFGEWWEGRGLSVPKHLSLEAVDAIIVRT